MAKFIGERIKMIMEWNGNLAQDPEQVLRPLDPDRRKPVRPAAAAAWEAEQLRRLRQSGLQRPKRPSHSSSLREEERAMAAENSSATQQGLESSEEVQQSNATSPETLAIQASEQTLDHGTDETAPAPAVPQVVVPTPESVLAPVPTPVVKPEVPVFEAAIPVAPRPALQKAPVKSSRSAKPAGPSGFQRIVSMARTVLPIAEKLLPLLDGNVATAAANVFAPRPTPKPVDLTPLERSIDKLKGGHADLQGQLAEQSTHLRKVATQVKTLEETAHKLQSERDDLEEDVLTLRKRLSVVSRVAFTLIGLLVAADAYFILHNLRILP